MNETLVCKNNSIQQDSIFALTNLAIVRFRGDQVIDFLQGQFTCDVIQVNESCSSYGALCNPQGRVLAIFDLFKKDNDFFCILANDIATKFIKTLTKFAVFSKVVVEDVTADFMIYGVIGEKTVNELFQEVPNNPCEVVTNNGFFVSRCQGAMPHFLIWGPHAQNQSLTKNVTTDQTGWQWSRILSSVATIHLTTVATVTPHMLNLDRLGAISFKKGCYVGQEIIARTHYLGKSKRHLYRAQLTGRVTFPGDFVYDENQEVGLVINSVMIEKEQTILIVIQDSAATSALYINEEQLQNLEKC